MSGSLPQDKRQAAQYLAIKTTAGDQKLQIVSISGTERLSTPYAYEIELYTTVDGLSWEGLVGSEATVTINGTGKSSDTRHIHGIFSEFALAGSWDGAKRTYFRATLVPPLALLDLRQDCRIFQNKSALDIIKSVLSGGGVSDLDLRVTATYQPREYCVQWRETDLNFIMRLMEDEGIFFWFEHTDGVVKMVLADDADGHKNLPVVPAVTFSGVTSLPFQDDQVRDCSLAMRMVPDAVGVDAWSFETPATALYAKKTGKSSKNTINDWWHLHDDKSKGEKLAGIRLGAYEVEKKLLRIRGNNRYFRCGGKFSLSKHPESALNGSWVVMEHRLDATPEEFRCELAAFSATTVFRAARIAQRPTIASTQTAIVTGTSGEEIETDKYGRVKVQFHWDRVGKKDQNSSCWIRVAQGWAGTGWGALFIPRIGTEVVVSFLDGDPDRPLITGCVYNAEKTVPTTLPTDKTKSTIKTRTSPNGAGKFNEIRFEDKAEKEEIAIQAQKDLTLKVLNDRTGTITNDDTLTVDGKQTLKVKKDLSLEVTEGNETHTVKAGKRTVKVKGDETHTNEAKFTHTVDGDYALTVKGKMSIDVTGGLTITAQKITIKSESGEISVESATDLKLKGTKDLKAEGGVNFSAKGTQTKIEGAAQLDIAAPMANFKASGMGEVSAGGILTVKGGIVKIN
jgi:type VI secretion system secreted protein VgrG